MKAELKKILYRIRIAPGPLSFLQSSDEFRGTRLMTGAVAGHRRRFENIAPVLEIALDAQEDGDLEQQARQFGRLVGFKIVDYFVDNAHTPSIVVSVEDYDKLKASIKTLSTKDAEPEGYVKEMSEERNYDERMKGALLTVFANLIESGKTEVKPLTKENLDDDDSDLDDFLNDLKSRAVTP